MPPQVGRLGVLADQRPGLFSIHYQSSRKNKIKTNYTGIDKFWQLWFCPVASGKLFLCKVVFFYISWHNDDGCV
jgi:hypothetical protein